MDEQKLAELAPYSSKITQMDAMIAFMQGDDVTVRITVLRPSEDPEKALQFTCQMTGDQILYAKNTTEAELRKQQKVLRDYLKKQGVSEKPKKNAKPAAKKPATKAARKR